MQAVRPSRAASSTSRWRACWSRASCRRRTSPASRPRAGSTVRSCAAAASRLPACGAACVTGLQGLRMQAWVLFFDRREQYCDDACAALWNSQKFPHRHAWPAKHIPSPNAFFPALRAGTCRSGSSQRWKASGWRSRLLPGQSASHDSERSWNGCASRTHQSMLHLCKHW